MSKAATELLLELGANVYAIDINKIDLPVIKAFQADMSQKEEIDRVIEELPWYCSFPWQRVISTKGKFLQSKIYDRKITR